MIDLSDMKPDSGKCEDCGLKYENFGLDTVLSDEQWAMICPGPDGEGVLLCSNCIIKRASFLPGIIVGKMVLRFASDY